MFGPNVNVHLDCHSLNSPSSQLRNIPSAIPVARSGVPSRTQKAEAKSGRRSCRSVVLGCPIGPGLDRNRRASKKRCHFGCFDVDPLTPAPRRERPFRGAPQPPHSVVKGDFRGPLKERTQTMTALQRFYSLRHKARTIWTPILLALFLAGACVPAKHKATPQPVQSPTAINRARADGAGKTKLHPSVRALVHHAR